MLPSSTRRPRPILISYILFVAATALGLSHPATCVGRRQSLIAILGGSAILSPLQQQPSFAASPTDIVDYRKRPRKGNKEAIVRDDYWFLTGKTPPRVLGARDMSDAEMEQFGFLLKPSSSCAGGDDTECTTTADLAPLRKSIPAYEKYAPGIAAGAREYQQVRQLLSTTPQDWAAAETLLRTPNRAPPPPPVDAELKMISLASAVLSSGPAFSLASYYVNELHFTHEEILAAIEAKNGERAMAAWEYGRDAWNSYLQCIDRQIVPQVGPKFDRIV